MPQISATTVPSTSVAFVFKKSLIKEDCHRPRFNTILSYLNSARDCSHYRLAELNLSNLQPSAKLLAEVFLTQNKTWAAICPTPQQAYQFMFEKTKEMLEWQQELRDTDIIPKGAFINFVYLDETDNIVAVWTNFQLTQYLSKKSKVYLKQFDILQCYGQQLQKSIDCADKVAGKAIYGMFTAIRPELMGIGFVGFLWHDGCHYLQNLGFKVLYGRASNIKSKVLIVKVGGEMISKLSSHENGKKITLSFVKYELNRQKLELLRYLLRQKLQAKL